MRYIVLFIFGCFFAISVAQAQNNSINERVQNNAEEPYILRSNDPIFYDKNLLILKKPKLWTAYANPTIQYTDNAFLTSSNLQSDFIASFTSGLDFNLKMPNKIALNAGISASRFEYKNNNALGYNSLQGNIGASYSYKNWVASFGYGPTLVYEKDFDNRSITLHRLSVVAARNKVYWSKLIFTSYGAAHYIRANPDEFSYTQFDSGLRLLYPITHKWSVALNPHLYQKSYNDFFEDQTGVQRNDIGVRIGSNLTYAPQKNMYFSASLSYTRNKSTLDSSNYALKNVAPSIRFSYRF